MDDTEIESLREIYEQTRTIAVVGASNNPTKPANSIPRYLQGEGFRIIPVNPREDQVLGERAYPSLADIPDPVDVVDVFRPGEEAPEIAREAAKIGAKVLWLQQGIESAEAGNIAKESGLRFVSNRCMGETHWMLFHEEEE